MAPGPADGPPPGSETRPAARGADGVFDDSDTATQDSDMQGEPTENGYRYDSFPSYHNRRRADAEATGTRDAQRQQRHQHHHQHQQQQRNGPSSKTTAAAASAAVTSTRALAPDLLRGLLMVVMALDHNAIALHTWSHGTGRDSEADGGVVRRFNFATAYVVRTLTHLCAPGFTFLLGMGVVYLGRSRRGRLGWSAARLARYFAVRAAVLTLVTAVFGLVVTAGKVWFMNMVLFALAVDYLLAGLLWLAMDKTEVLLARGLARWMKTSGDEGVENGDDQGERRPLLQGQAASTQPEEVRDSKMAQAAAISWHVHNAALVVLGVVTIWWNIWLSENHGHCQAVSSSSASSSASSSSSSSSPSTATSRAPQNPLLRIWFWPVMDLNGRVMSGFPPLAWLSFAILGLLYGRILISRPRSPRALASAHALVALLFALVFVLTRLLHVGNLSEGCLQTPAQERQPAGANPYLADARSFFYIIKYPPDVALWALTMAGNLMLLALFWAVPARLGRRLTVLLDFGTTALFFYIAHMLLVFALGMALVALFGHDTGVADPMDPENRRGIDNLWAYFGVWALAMLLLWPVCRAYSRFKSTKSADSIWRFF